MKARITTIEDAKNLAKDFAKQAEEQSKENRGIFTDLIEEFEKINPELGGFEEFAMLLSMPEEQFALLAPIFLDELQKSMNNTNDRLFLAQALNAAGQTSEDMQKSINKLFEEIDAKLDKTISKQKKDFLKRLLAITYNCVAETEGVSKKIIQIPIECCHPDAKIPTYANLGDAGLDIYAIDDFTIAPGETKLIPTGLKVAIPYGYELQVRPKSGRALKTKMRVANTPGTIDSGYRDEIGIIIDNIEPPIKDIAYEFDENGRPIITSILHGNSYTIGKGEKFAQLVLNEIPKVSFFEVENISEIKGDRGGGFGSSGLK